MIFVGYHAKADAPRGLFAHTGSGVVRDLQVNGVSVGEGGMNAAMAAWYGVAVALVTGDDAAVEEVKAIAPGVRTVAVKRAINTRAVELLPLAEARRQIEEGARQAVAGSEEAGAGPHRPLQGDDALPRHDHPRGGQRVPRDGALSAPTRWPSPATRCPTPIG